MGETKEYITLLNMRSQLRIGFKTNMVNLVTVFRKVGLIDDECYETVTPAVTPSQKAEAITRSVINSVELSEARYGEMMRILAANPSIYGPLVEKLDDEYIIQGGINIYAKRREAVQPKAFHTVILPVWSTEIRMNSWNLVRYYDPKTFKKKDLRILEDIAADWEVIGEILGFRPPRIKAIRCAGAGKTPAQCLRGVLTRWMVNANVMPNSDRYPSTWQGLHNLLVDSLHGATAKDLTDAIDTPYSDLHSNFDKAPEDKSARVIASEEAPPTRPQETSHPSAPEPQKATQDKPAATAGATAGATGGEINTPDASVHLSDSSMSSTDRDSRIFPISICSCVALFGGILGLLGLVLILLAIAIAAFMRFGGSIHPACTAMDNCSPSLHQMQYFKLSPKFPPIYIIQEVAHDCKTLGIDLNLPPGLIWSVWGDHGTQEERCTTTLNHWLQGKGQELATWQTFLQGLRKHQLHDIADRIQKQLQTLFSTKYC